MIFFWPLPLNGADALGRVVQAEDVGGLQDLDLAAQRLEAFADEGGDAFHAFDVLAARFDVDQVAHGVEHGLLLVLGGVVHGGHGGGQDGGGSAQAGQGEEGAKDERT